MAKVFLIWKFSICICSQHTAICVLEWLDMDFAFWWDHDKCTKSLQVIKMVNNQLLFAKYQYTLATI